MKIRNQSYLLIAGIAAMPFLVVAIALTFQWIYARSRDIPPYSEVTAALQDAIVTRDPDAFARAVEHRPPEVDLAVADGGGIIVFSTIPEIPAGAPFDRAFWASLQRNDPGRVYQFGMPADMPAGYVVFSKVPRSVLSPFRLLGAVAVVATAALAAIVVFAAAMSINMVRSITRSVLLLDEATRRVASGELDVPIDVEGSNEITSLVGSLNRMREEIKEDSARRARFVMGVSHDLKTPIALIQGYAEALEDVAGMRAGSSEGARYLSIIQDKASRLADMIDDLIDFVRVDTGEWRRAQQPVRLAAFLKLFVRRIEADAALLGRRALGRIDVPEHATVRMDERLATRALENLVNNALRYTSEGGCVTVSARGDGDRWVLEVADDGPGIAPQDLLHVFEPFYRGTASRREDGLGLGLSVVKSIIESHGWAITLSSQPSRGCLFTIAIPAEAP